ncbi:MAG: hypothetical protein JO058_22390 [Alphaproteobacteria bacterium]|nr:hypothetical protein [Alphaproteobacteria bacterium]
MTGLLTMTIGSDFLATGDGQPHLARIDAQSRVEPLGEPVGFFEDGWVRAHARFSIRALDAITSISLEVWSPPDAEPLSITVQVSHGPTTTLTAPRGRVAVLQFPLEIPPLGERSIEVSAERERQLSDRDRRQAAYKLGCIGLY